MTDTAAATQPTEPIAAPPLVAMHEKYAGVCTAAHTDPEEPCSLPPDLLQSLIIQANPQLAATGVQLSDDQVMIVAKVLAGTRTDSSLFVSVRELDHFEAARDLFDTLASDLLHASRSARRG